MTYNQPDTPTTTPHRLESLAPVLRARGLVTTPEATHERTHRTASPGKPGRGPLPSPRSGPEAGHGLLPGEPRPAPHAGAAGLGFPPPRAEHKTVWLGAGELIVGERGPRPKAVPTYPELLTCHSAEDLRILDSRPLTWYRVDLGTIEATSGTSSGPGRTAPCATRCSPNCPGNGRTGTRPAATPSSWSSGLPGTRWPTARSTARGCWSSRKRSASPWRRWISPTGPEALAKREELKGMDIACDAVVRWARRYADLAQAQAACRIRCARRSC